MMIERLEARIAPAGIVEVLVKNGALSLKTLAAGDGAEGITITSTGIGLFTIDPDAGTTLRVNGLDLMPDAPTNVTGITKTITIALGAGSDTLDFTGNVGGKLSIDLGEGDNHFTLRPASYAGDVSIKAGSGSDTVTSLPATGGTFFIGGKLSVLLGAGNNTLALGTSTTVGKDVLITSGTGMDSLRLDGGNSFSIGGSLTMQSGGGDDTLAVNLGGTFSVGKNVTFTSLGGAGTLSQTIASSLGVTIGGKASFSATHKGTLTQSIASSTHSVNIGGGVTFTGSGLVRTQLIDAATTLTIGGPVKMTALVPKTASMIPHEGAPEPAVPILTASQAITSDLTPSTSASSIKGPITLTGGDTVNLAVMGELRGAVTITTTNTFNNADVTLGQSNLNWTSRFLGPVKITFGPGGSATESVKFFGSVFAGTVTIAGSAQDTTFTVNDSTFTKAVSFAGNAGGDTVNWEVGSLGGGFAGRAFSTVKLLGGTGADSFHISSNAGNDVAFFLGQLTIDGSKDADVDTVTIGSAAQLLLPPKQLNLP